MIELLPYNLTTCRSTVKMLTEKGKEAIICPTGMDKPFVTIEICGYGFKDGVRYEH